MLVKCKLSNAQCPLTLNSLIRCMYCNTSDETTTKTFITQLPDYQILCLNRVDYSVQYTDQGKTKAKFRKSDKPVTIPQ